MARYIEQKNPNGVWYFRRRVPHDVQRHYPKLNKRGEIYFSLQTKDRNEAAKLAHRKATEQDGFWKSVRSGEVAAGPEVISAAIALLDTYGLRPGQSVEYTGDELQVDRFLDDLRIEAEAFRPEDQRENWQNDLPLVHQQASDLFFGEKPPLFLSEGLQKYFELTGEDPNKRQGIGRTRVVNYFISVCGDLPVDRYTRSHANDFVRYLLEERKNRTATVTRRLNDIRPVFSTLCREYELQDREIFKSVIIPNKGKDSKEKLPYSNDEVRMIQHACLDTDDDIRWIVAVLSDTGMRMAEAVAIRVEDVFLDGSCPHIVLKEYETRSLKTYASTRLVPLCGMALWAVKRAKTNSRNGFLFPRYIDFDVSPPEHLADNASGAINGWLDSFPIKRKDQKTAHCFRHSMQDRLREAEVPEEIRNSILGWVNKGTGARYGTGFKINVLAEHMRKVVDDQAILPSNHSSIT